MQTLLEASITMDDGKFVLLGNRILIKLDKEIETYENSKLYIPEKHKKWAKQGVVMAVGSKVDRENAGINLNDKVCFSNSFVGIDMEINKEHFKILEPGDIDGVVEE